MTKGRVVVLTTGGTIASMPGGSGLNISGAMRGESLLEGVALPPPGLVEVGVESVLQKPSNAIGLDDLVTLSRRCEVLAKEPGVKGIVVTHGTDTLEETVHFLDVTLALNDCALVVTGSQRAPHEEGTDAFRNLADAITVAADDRLAGLGATVVFNQTIHAARQVRKLNTYRVDGFASPGSGTLGYVDGPRVHLALLPLRMPPLPLGDRLPRVDILPAYLDASPAHVEASISSGARGLVIDGLGRGHVPPGWLESVELAIEAGITVLVVSSCQEGPVNFSYEFPGSLASLVSLGAIHVPDQGARKARLSLAVMLSTSFPDGKEGMANWFQGPPSRP